MMKLSGRLMSACILSTVAAGGAVADDSAAIDLTGVRFRNATNQSRTSGSDTIDPAPRYAYDVDGFVRGESGLFAVFFPNPTRLADALEFFQPGASELLRGEINNPPATHPIVMLNQRFEGSIDIGTFGATVTVGIRADNVAYFEVKDVVINPSFVIGSLIFTSGTASIRGVECATDFNADGFVNGDDFDEFVVAFEAGALSADYNADGFVNGDDFDGFVLAFEEGC